MSIQIPPLIVIGHIKNMLNGVKVFVNKNAFGDSKLRVVIESSYEHKWDKIDGIVQIVIFPEPNEFGEFKVTGMSNKIKLPWTNGVVGVSFNRELVKEDWYLIRPEIGDSATILLSERSLPKLHATLVG